MNKFSKVIALALATTMVVGSTVTAFANDPSTTTPVTNGSSEGAGTSEGHVEKKATNVVLPTIQEGATPFKYIMDPEGLIVETAGAKFDNVVFPASTGDTHVYFNNGTNSDSKTVYANSSLALEAINKSSHNINLTIKAEVKDAAATDIPLVAQSAISTATAASLYLGLVVGTGDSESKTAIAADTAATKTVTIAGTAGNFKIAAKADKSGYEYRVLTLDEYKALDGNSAATALPWESESFKLEGETTEDKAITAATTAPKINVTWSWVDPEAAPTSYTVTYKSNYTDGPEDATEDVAANGNPNGPETAFTRTGYTLAGWATAADGEAAALSTYTITGTTTLYAIWTKDIEEHDGTVVVADGVFYVGTSSSAGLPSTITAEDIVSVTVNGKALTADQINVTTNETGTWVGAPATSIAAVGEDNGWASGTTWIFIVTTATDKYTASFTQQ